MLNKNQSYLLHHFKNASIQGRQIQYRKDQIQVYHVVKNIVEQSSTVPSVPLSIHSLGLILSTPVLI